MPRSTRALVHGAAPPAGAFQASAAGAAVTFAYDVTTAKVRYSLPGRNGIAAAVLHRGGTGENGPVVAHLAADAGEIRLNAIDRDALEHGRLYLEVTSESGTMARAEIRRR